MDDNAIQVRGLSKRYFLRERRDGAGGLRHAIEGAVRAPWQWLRSFHRSTDEEFWALKDVSFDVDRGEVVGIIGSNGAGKSTLLKILSRITPPTAGSVRLRGRVASLLEVGTGFHPELTGRENVFLNGAMLGMTRAEIKSRLDRIVAFAEIDRFLDVPVKRYSSGMYVRLAFAVAAHLEPEILIVDEVLAVGDAHFQKKCLGRMGEVSQSGRTVLFVSHNLHAVKKLCHRALILAEGRLTYSGSAADAVNRYQMLLNEPPASGLREVAVPEGAVRFTAWRILDSGSNLPHACYAREECRFEFTLVCRRRIDRVHLGFVIRALDDTILIAGHNLEDNGVPARLGSGVHRIVWRTRVPLRAGTYRLEVGAASEDEAPVRADDWRSPTPFEVIDPSPAFLSPDWQGILNERVTCEITSSNLDPEQE